LISFRNLNSCTRLLALLFLVLLFSFSQDLAGQKAFAADWSTDLILKGKTEYNDNVLFSRSDEIEDFVLHGITKIKIKGRTERTHFLLDSSVHGEKYIDHDYLDTVNTLNYLTLDHMWTERFNTKIKAHFHKDKTLQQELEAAGQPSRWGTRYRYGSELSGSYAMTEKLNITLGGGPNYYDYVDNQYPNLLLWRAFFDNSWTITQRNLVGSRISYDDADYENSTTVRTLSGTVYYQRRWSERTDITLGAGYRHTWTKYYSYFLVPVSLIDGRLAYIVEKEKISDSEDGFIFNASLNHRWSQRLTYYLAAGREHYNAVDARSIDRTFVRTRLKYAITERMDLGLRFHYDKTQDDLSNGRDNDNIMVAPFVSWALSEHLKLKVATSYRYNKEKLRLNKYHRKRFKGWVSLTWELPRIFANH